ncbi:MAG TPA: hypothetical protein VJT31_20910 [Rugosimonospora sp.]|nr:hypothetical protein [Rugosimonospora sp.]
MPAIDIRDRPNAGCTVRRATAPDGQVARSVVCNPGGWTLGSHTTARAAQGAVQRDGQPAADDNPPTVWWR